MPFEKISLFEQDSQQAIILNICGDVLVCKMTGMNSKGAISERWEWISRAPGLREADLDPDVWELSALNSRLGVDDGPKSGVTENISPPYITGEEIFITKKLKDPIQIDEANQYGNIYGALQGPAHLKGPSSCPEDASQDSCTSCAVTGSEARFGKNMNTAAFMVDENRAGRSWGTIGGGGGGEGMPTGYEAKCVAFCEGGETTSGTILFNPGGCEPVSSTGPDGTGPGGTSPDGTYPGGTHPGGTGPGGTHPGGGGVEGWGEEVRAAGSLPPQYRPDAPSAGTIDFIPL